MTEPLRPAGSTPAPAPIELEPILISAHPSTSGSVPVPVGDIALNCLSQLDGVALALLTTPANPVVGTLVAAKAGLELGKCIAETMNRAEEDASIRRALLQCAEAGGTPGAIVNHELECAVRMKVP